MTSSNPASPSSDRSSRSDWFRQSVLFWSGGGHVSEEAVNDEFTIDDTKPSSSLASSSTSLNKESSLKSEPAVEIKKTSVFDPSELLRQVDELERCFSQGSSTANLSDVSCNSAETNSPHLTLEFPPGSSIKTNPIYRVNVEKDSVVSSNEQIMTRDKKELKTEQMTQASKRDNDRNYADQQEIKSNLNDTSNNDVSVIYSPQRCMPAEPEHHIVDSIQKVQDTLIEISREIHCSRDKCAEEKTTRDPNVVLGNLLSGIHPPEEMERGLSPTPKLPVRIRNYSNKDRTMEPCNELFMNSNIVSDSSLSQVVDKLTPHTARKCSHPNSVRISSPPHSTRARSKNEILLQQIDDMIELEHALEKRQTFPLTNKTVPKKTDQRDRLDSGLQSTSSDSHSPYPSPLAIRALSDSEHLQRNHDYDSGYSDATHAQNTPRCMYELSKVNNDSVFHEESDMSSDWSPISTMSTSKASINSTINSAHSNSVSRSVNYKQPKTNNHQMSTGNMDKRLTRDTDLKLDFRFDITSRERTHSESELHAIRKFLTLATQYMGRGDGYKLFGLDELASLPKIKEAIETQKKEIYEQHTRQEEFLSQLGDLLLKIVNLKEEQSTVRRKQAKAISLLKRQLDIHKKNQSQAHIDVLNQVSNLNEKIDNSLNLSADQLSNTPTTVTPRLVPNNPVHSSVDVNHGQVIWKISDFTKKITRVKTGILDSNVVSQPFQTTVYGYKMNGWIYLNGRGKMVGKYLSVYVCVLVGDYDAILSWPITPTYKFTLIDQQSDVNKRQDLVKVRRVVDIAGRGGNVISQNGGIPRPAVSGKALIVGFDDFVAHEQLLDRRYLVDDVLFLKIEANV